MRAALLLAAALMPCGCAMPQPPRPAVVAPPGALVLTGWRAEVRAEDAARIARLPATWATARAAASPHHAAALAEAGALLVADAALEHPVLPPGSYDCRLTSLGHERGRQATYARFGSFFCYIRGEAGGALSFTKQTGSDLPGGWLHPDGDRRFVFVGARQRTPGVASLGYGTDRARDLVGVVERIAPMRWRLVLPSRTGDGALDIYELTPVPSDRQGAEAPPG